jgi:KaiC/GvpD/RAD55 family RecA-like ATPase
MSQPPTAHVPPQNIEAEESVLGAMLVAEPALTRVIDEVKLNAEDFYLEKHGVIFDCARDLYAASKPVDELSVGEALTQRNQIDAAGGRHYVSELAAKVPAAGNAKHYAEIVQQNSLLRRLLGAGQQIQSWVHERSGESPEELIRRGNEALGELSVELNAVDSSSWAPLDLTDALGGAGDAEPTVLRRSDGRSLLYPERIAEAVGEPESGKSWFANVASVEQIAAGNPVLYLDFESTPLDVVQRMLALGLTAEQIADLFIYARPDEPVESGGRSHLEAALQRKPALVVVDGVTEALTIHGLDLNDNADVARWLELLPRPAARAGSAVLLIDHVVKEKESRGRYGIGAQHKLAGIDVAYTLNVVEPFGRGRSGLVKVKVRKDRPGHVRAFEEGDGQVALMRLKSDPESGSVTVALDPPDASDTAGDFRPTVLMERISEALEQHPGMSISDIRRTVTGKNDAKDTALRLLVEDGFVSVTPDGQARRHSNLRLYRASEDPKVDPSNV